MLSSLLCGSSLIKHCTNDSHTNHMFSLSHIYWNLKLKRHSKHKINSMFLVVTFLFVGLFSCLIMLHLGIIFFFPLNTTGHSFIFYGVHFCTFVRFLCLSMCVSVSICVSCFFHLAHLFFSYSCLFLYCLILLFF